MALALLLTAHLAQAGEFSGVGVQVVPTAQGHLVVLQVVTGTPAAEAGLLPGDLILAVDEVSLAGKPLTETARQLLWGGEGSAVMLKFLRPGVAGQQRVTLQRRKMVPPTSAPDGVQLLRPETAGE